MLNTSPTAAPVSQPTETSHTTTSSGPSIDVQAQRIALMLEALLSSRDRPIHPTHPLSPTALDQSTVAALLRTIGLSPTLPTTAGPQTFPGRPIDPSTYRPGSDNQFDPIALAQAHARILNLLQQQGAPPPAPKTHRDVASEAARSKGDSAQAQLRDAQLGGPSAGPGSRESINRAAALNVELPRNELASHLNGAKAIAPSPDIKAILNDPGNGNARILQAVLQAESSLRSPKRSLNDSINESNPSQTSNLESLKNSIAERTSALKNSLEKISEQHQARLASEKNQEAVSGTSSKQGVDPQKIGANEKSESPSLTIASEGRATSTPTNAAIEAPSNTDTIHSRSHSPSQSYNQSRSEPTVRIRDPQVTSEALASIRGDLLRSHSLLSAIERATQRLVNFDLLRQIDRAMETAVISAAAAITLGVITADTVIKELLALLKLLNDNLEQGSRDKPERESAEGKDDLKEGEELEARNLDQISSDQENKVGAVADLTGLIVIGEDERPLENVLVSGSTLGHFVTNAQGYYKLANLPIGSSYHLSFSYPGLSFTPASISGIVGLNNFIRVVASREAF